MQVQRIDNLFNFTFEKTSAEIVEKARTKVDAIRRKIEEREVRIRRAREEYKITDTILLDIMAKARDMQQRGGMITYTSSVPSAEGAHEEEVTIGAGVVNMLLTERDHIEGEKSQVERLDMILRNLKDLRRFAPDGKEYRQGHELTSAELKFLDF